MRDDRQRGGQRVGEAVVSVDARNLFDQVDLTFEVEPPRGKLDGEGCRLTTAGWCFGECAAEGGEDLADEIGSESGLVWLVVQRGTEMTPICVNEREMGARLAVRAATEGTTTSTSSPSGVPPDCRMSFATSALAGRRR